jgi:hypothetical protein
MGAKQKPSSTQARATSTSNGQAPSEAMSRLWLAATLLTLIALLLSGCGGSEKTVATTNNCAGLPAKEYQECVTEEAINSKVGFESPPMSEDEEAELEGRSPP